MSSGKIICTNSVFRSIFLLLCLTGRMVFAQGYYDEKVTSVSNVSATISNLGLIGNAFSGSFQVLGYPSCEFPANSGIEHLFEGGLWLGINNGGFKDVTTGAGDDPSGYSTGKAGFEYTADLGAKILERSTLLDNPYFSTTAVSHQDFVSDFTDKNTIVPGSGSPGIAINQHTRPLMADVHFEAYNWNFSFANFFVVMDFTITNNSTSPWDSFYIGFWSDGVVRNVNITPPGGSAFYNKGGNGFIDSIYLGYEFDANGDIGYTDSYVGLKFLGVDYNNAFYHPDLTPNFKAHYNTWQFRNTADPLYFYPDQDFERYDKLASGLNDLPTWNTTIVNQIKAPNNRSNLLSAGPLPSVLPGEKVRVAFAFVFSKKKGNDPASLDNDYQKLDLVKNANWAQTAFNGEDANFNGILDPGEDRDNNGVITRYILPEPPANPKVKILPKDNTIEVYWSNTSEQSIDPISKTKDFAGYRMYKTQLGFDIQNTQDILGSLNLTGQWDITGDSVFEETGLDKIKLSSPVKFEGDTSSYYYKYVFTQVPNGWQHGISVTSFDRGDKINNLESLESSSLATLKRVFPGKPANASFQNGDPFVYPNPYYASASWEGSSKYEEDRKLIFANLPEECEVRIYTVAGDLVDRFDHTSDYNGSDIKWFETYSDPSNSQFSGGEHAWDLLSANQQLLARGLYLFSVKDKRTDKIYRGKFVLIK